MTVDVINVDASHLKEVAISLFNSENNMKSTIPLSSLEFRKTADANKVLLQDPVSKAGIVMSKINIATIFPTVLDLRPFKNVIYNTAKKIDGTQVDKFNNKYNTDLIVEESDILDTRTAYDPELVKHYVLFCRVYGFHQLKLSECSLSIVEDKLYISVNSTHELFTGYLEVLV